MRVDISTKETPFPYYVVFNNNTYTQQVLLSILYIIPAVRMFVCLIEENKSILLLKKNPWYLVATGMYSKSNKKIK